jgi:hypothetical protein
MSDIELGDYWLKVWAEVGIDGLGGEVGQRLDLPVNRVATWESEQMSRLDAALANFVRNAPYEPLATPAEVLEVPCSLCGAIAGEPCGTSRFLAFAAGMFLRGFGGHNIHLRRYQDKAHDPR